MKQLNNSPEMSQPVSGDAGFPGLNLCARGTYSFKVSRATSQTEQKMILM